MRRWRSYEEAHADLSALEPADRLPVLLEVWRGETSTLDYDEVRRLFILAWADGQVPTEHDHEVLGMLRWIAPVRDPEQYLVGTLTIYRGADGDDRSIRWTLDEERAAMHPEARGIHRATVKAHHVLAHLTAGGKNHVLVDPHEIENVELVQSTG